MSTNGRNYVSSTWSRGGQHQILIDTCHNRDIEHTYNMYMLASLEQSPTLLHMYMLASLEQSPTLLHMYMLASLEQSPTFLILISFAMPLHWCPKRLLLQFSFQRLVLKVCSTKETIVPFCKNLQSVSTAGIDNNGQSTKMSSGGVTIKFITTWSCFHKHESHKNVIQFLDSPFNDALCIERISYLLLITEFELCLLPNSTLMNQHYQLTG